MSDLLWMWAGCYLLLAGALALYRRTPAFDRRIDTPSMASIPATTDTTEHYARMGVAQ